MLQNGTKDLTEKEIEKFYEDFEALELKFPVAAIVEHTGFSKGTVSEYLSRKKPPSKNFLKRFYDKFYKGSTGNDPEYIKLLQDNDKFFKNLIQANLKSAELIQESILAHLKAIVQEDAERKAGGDRKKYEKQMAAWGKRIALNLGLPAQTGTHEPAGK